MKKLHWLAISAFGFAVGAVTVAGLDLGSANASAVKASTLEERVAMLEGRVAILESRASTSANGPTILDMDVDCSIFGCSRKARETCDTLGLSKALVLNEVIEQGTWRLKRVACSQ